MQDRGTFRDLQITSLTCRLGRMTCSLYLESNIRSCSPLSVAIAMAFIDKLCNCVCFGSFSPVSSLNFSFFQVREMATPVAFSLYPPPLHLHAALSNGSYPLSCCFSSQLSHLWQLSLTIQLHWPSKMTCNLVEQ